MSSIALLAYAKNMFDIYNLKNERIIGYIDDYESFDINYFSSIIKLDNYNYEISKKTNTEGFYMNWHLDNALVIKNKKNSNKSPILPEQIDISDRHRLHYFIKKPIYTLIVYESDYLIDFTGGTLEFIDGYIVKPKKGLYIFFNSNEVHRVNKILSGSRINYLIKFYKK